MKKLLFVITLGAALAIPAFAQDSTNTPPSGPPPEGGPGGHHDHGGMMKFLTPAEQTELKKAHEAAIAKDPSLGTEEQSIHEAMKSAHESGTPPTDAEKQQWHDFRDKLDAAMIAADPDVAPILAKIKAHHHGPGGPGAGGPPPSGPAPSAN